MTNQTPAKRTFSKTLPSQNPSSAHQSEVETGKFAQDEANLTTMPFVRPNPNNREGPVEFEWTAVGRDGQSHDFFQVFKPGRNASLPGPTAGRIMRALLSISSTPLSQNRRVKTRLDQLAGVCRLSKSGGTYERIRRAFARLQGLTIESNAFWDYANQKYTGARRIELFSSHHFDTSSSKTVVEFRWTPAVADLVTTWARPLNLNHLFQLDSCIARKLYQVSSLGVYQEGEMVEDLKLLCHGHLGISQDRKYPSELKRSLKKPVTELREKNLIDLTIQEDTGSPSIKSGWLVRAQPMEGMQEVCEEIEDPQYWACHLAGRGMMDLKDAPLAECRKWVDKKGVHRVREVIGEYDERCSGESAKTPIRHAGWIHDVLKRDIDLEDQSEYFSTDSSTSTDDSGYELIY